MKDIFLKNGVWAFAMLALCLTTSCDDDEDSYADVDGASPTMVLASSHIQSAAGRTFTIEATLTDNDGIAYVDLDCEDLYLDKTIDILTIYDGPLTSYDLSYSYALSSSETQESFTVVITVTDVGGRSVSDEVLVTLDGDFASPVFTQAPDSEVTVLLKSETTFKLSFVITDDTGLDYVLVNIPGVDDYEDLELDADGALSFSYSEKIPLPSEAATYNITLTAYDLVGNSTVATSVVVVDELQDFSSMYLADVATTDELNSDLFGVPMLIMHTGEYSYLARYYNETAGTEIYFLPQMSDFSPICFGLDPDDNTMLTDDPDTAEPFVLDQAGVYYQIEFNTMESTYSISTYSVDDATDPIPENYVYGEATFDAWEDGGSWMIDFYIGWGSSPSDVEDKLFAQDADNPHLFYFPEDSNTTWTLTAEETMNFALLNWHPGGWWDHVEWRVDNSTDPQKFGYYSKKGDVNENWEGTNMKWADGTTVGDNWCSPTVKTTGNYRFVFDAHLGRGKIVLAE